MDSCDSDRLGIAKQELMAMLEVISLLTMRGTNNYYSIIFLIIFFLCILMIILQFQEDELKDAILLVFANKQDARGALNSQQVE